MMQLLRRAGCGVLGHRTDEHERVWRLDGEMGALTTHSLWERSWCSRCDQAAGDWHAVPWERLQAERR